MKIIRLHIVFLILVFANPQQIIATPVAQKPENTRAFDNNFKSRYSGRKFNYEGEEIVNQTPSGSGNYEDYKNENPSIKEKNNSDAISINLGPIAWLFYAALAIAVVYLVYILVHEGGSGLFSTKKNRTLNTFEAITAQNIEHTDIGALIKNAEKNNDFRLAIRYYYLLALKNLSLKNYITFEDDKTNAEYLNETSKKAFHKTFAYASYLYNYTWYGKFPLNTNEYQDAKRHFTTLLNQVG